MKKNKIQNLHPVGNLKNCSLTEAELEDIVNNISDFSDNEGPLQNKFQENDSDFSDKIENTCKSKTGTESDYEDDNDKYEQPQLPPSDDDERKYFYGKSEVVQESSFK